MNYRISGRLAATLAVAGLLVGGSALHADVKSAILPDANAVIYVDAKSISESQFSKAAENLFPDSQEMIMQDEKMAEALEALNVTEKDIGEFILSMAGVDTLFAGGQPDMKDAKVSGAFTVNKPLDFDKAYNLLSQEISEEEKQYLSKGEISGMKAMMYKGNPESPDMAMWLKSGDASSTVYFADIGSAEAVASGASKKLPAGIAAAAAPVAGSQVWMALDLPQSVRNTLSQQTRQNPPLGAGSERLGKVESLAMGAKVGEAMDLKVALNYPTPEDVNVLKPLLQFSVLPMAKMMLGQGGAGTPPFLNTANVGAEGTTLSLNLTLTEADLKFMKNTGVQGEPQSEPIPAPGR